MNYKFLTNNLLPIFLSLVCIKSFSEEINKYQNRSIKWEKFNEEKSESENKKIKWDYLSDEEWQIEYKNLLKIEEKFEKGQKSDATIISQGFEYLRPLQILPTIQLNNFLSHNSFSNDFTIKSAFDGGAAGGTGNQNYSFRIDYGLSDEQFLSAYISEADDPYYFEINNSGDLPSKNYWRNYALQINRKFKFSEFKKFNFSSNMSLELWDLATLFKKNDSVLDYHSGKKFIGSISFPATYKFNENLNITLAPRITYIPKRIGSSTLRKNFYGNNYSLGIGLDYKLFENSYFMTSYTFLYGPGNNSFDNNLNFSRNSIYSYGFKWDPSPRVGLEASITNSFGATPATGLLTIPSGNIPLYSLKLNLNTDFLDLPQRSYKVKEIKLMHKAHTVNTGLIPERGENQVSFDIDSEGNYFGFYGYSFSNIFQIEFVNLGSIGNSNLDTNDKFSDLQNTYYGKGNLNNRFGGKLILLSPTKGSPFWLTTRMTLGRDQKSDQGYLFGELINTFELNPITTIHINPKLTWSGIKSMNSIGLGLNYELNDNISLIPELNINLSDTYHNNSSFTFRFLPKENKTIDLYISNALGTQDMAQMLKSNNLKIGLKLNYIF